MDASSPIPYYFMHNPEEFASASRNDILAQTEWLAEHMQTNISVLFRVAVVGNSNGLMKTLNTVKDLEQSKKAAGEMKLWRELAFNFQKLSTAVKLEKAASYDHMETLKTQVHSLYERTIALIQQFGEGSEVANIFQSELRFMPTLEGLMNNHLKKSDKEPVSGVTQNAVPDDVEQGLLQKAQHAFVDVELALQTSLRGGRGPLSKGQGPFQYTPNFLQKKPHPFSETMAVAKELFERLMNLEDKMVAMESQRAKELMLQIAYLPGRKLFEDYVNFHVKSIEHQNVEIVKNGVLQFGKLSSLADEMEILLEVGKLLFLRAYRYYDDNSVKTSIVHLELLRASIPEKKQKELLKTYKWKQYDHVVSRTHNEEFRDSVRVQLQLLGGIYLRLQDASAKQKGTFRKELDEAATNLGKLAASHPEADFSAVMEMLTRVQRELL